MPPKKSARTQLHVTDNHGRDDTLQAVASTAEHTTPSVVPEVEIDDDDDRNNDLGNHLDDDLDSDLDNDPGGRRHEDCPIDNDIGDLRCQITDEDRLEVAIQN